MAPTLTTKELYAALEHVRRKREYVESQAKAFNLVQTESAPSQHGLREGYEAMPAVNVTPRTRSMTDGQQPKSFELMQKGSAASHHGLHVRSNAMQAVGPDRDRQSGHATLRTGGPTMRPVTQADYRGPISRDPGITNVETSVVRKVVGKGVRTDGKGIFYCLEGKNRCDLCTSKQQTCLVDLEAISKWRKAVEGGQKFMKAPYATECTDCFMAQRVCLLPATEYLRALLGPYDEAWQMQKAMLKAMERTASAAEEHNRNMMEFLEVYAPSEATQEETKSDADWIASEDDDESGGDGEDNEDESDDATSTASSEAQ